MDLYHSSMSTCSQKVRLVLYEKGLSFVERRLNLRAGDAARAEYLRLNPNGVVPTLVDRGAAIIESTAICEYLEDVYPEQAVRPADPAARAWMRTWTLRSDQGLHRACGVITFAVAVREQMLALGREQLEQRIAQKPDPAVREYQQQVITLGMDAPQVPAALRLCDRVLADADRQLQNAPWLAGNEYSLADTAMLPYVCRLEDMSMSWMWGGKRSAIARWLEDCRARANYRAIADYLEPESVAFMAERGMALSTRLRSIIGG